ALSRNFPELTQGEARQPGLSPEDFVRWLGSCARGATGRAVAIHLASGPRHPAWASLESAGAMPFTSDDQLGGLELRGRPIGVLYSEGPSEKTRESCRLSSVGGKPGVVLVPDPAQQRFCEWGAHTLRGQAEEPSKPGTAP